MNHSFVFEDADLATIRRAYARQMLAVAGIAGDPALEDAFAAVPRERFLGPPPWRVVAAHGGGYRDLPSSDPVLAYQDINFALVAERGVNNGSPSLHARWLHHAGLKKGSRVALSAPGRAITPRSWRISSDPRAMSRRSSSIPPSPVSPEATWRVSAMSRSSGATAPNGRKRRWTASTSISWSRPRRSVGSSRLRQGAALSSRSACRGRSPARRAAPIPSTAPVSASSGKARDSPRDGSAPFSSSMPRALLRAVAMRPAC